MAKNILITGGVGFLGTNLSLRLLGEGHRVVALDNFYTGTQGNLDILKQHKNFSFIKHDVVEKFPVIEGIDEVYHLACPASPPHYQKDPIYTFKISIDGAINALDFATDNNAKILLASTSEIYGDPEVHPQTESYRGAVNTLGIRACYDEGKRGAETLFMDYYRTKKTKIKIMRIFNTYGPYMDPNDGRVVSNLICQALRGDELTIYGEGLQTRSFCYVDDLISGMVALMNSVDEVTGPVNIGNPDEFTILQLAELIREKLGFAQEIKYFPMPQDDPKQRRPDITLAKEKLNWQPHITLEQGLEKTIPWFRQCLFSEQKKEAKHG
jgi:UDP-glucuronate decarboxylase